MDWWPSVLAVALFTIIGQFVSYLIYHHLFRYDRPTAFFAASPGGFFENIAMGKEAGGDPMFLTLLQFLRLVSILILVPFGFSIWAGETVGSAAGQGFSNGQSAADPGDYALILFAAGAGYGLATLARVPMAMIIGPLVLSASLHLTGILQAQPHALFMIIAQVVLGASLGARFAGLKARDLMTAFKACGTAVVWLLSLAVLFALVMAQLTEPDLAVYIMTFAPAGVIEMSLVALSLDINPAFVTTHHVVRILITVLIIPIFYHRFFARR